MVWSTLPPRRVLRAWNVGATATALLYCLMVVAAEPARSLAATSSSNSVVSVIVADSLSNSCTASVSLGTITRTGDTSFNTCAAYGFCATNATTCTIVTNNISGYTLTWLVATGTGAAGSRTGTGHLNGYVAGNRIRALTPAVAGTPEAFSNQVPTANVTNDARWAARLSSTSTTTGGAGIAWGSDGTNDTWLNVGTGSAVAIASRATPTGGAGDSEVIGFRAVLNGSVIVPTDTYKATVTFTATTNP